MLQRSRQAGMRVALVGGLLAAVVCLSAADYTLFPTSDESAGAGAVGNYTRYESPVVVEPRHGRGAYAWWVGPVVGLLVAGLVGAGLVSFRVRRRHLAPGNGGLDAQAEPTSPAALGAGGRRLGTGRPSGDVAAAWRRVEELVLDRGVPPPPSRTAASTAADAIAVGAPPSETRELARLYDLARYSGVGVTDAVADRAGRLADVIVRGVRT